MSIARTRFLYESGFEMLLNPGQRFAAGAGFFLSDDPVARPRPSASAPEAAVFNRPNRRFDEETDDSEFDVDTDLDVDDEDEDEWDEWDEEFDDEDEDDFGEDDWDDEDED